MDLEELGSGSSLSPVALRFALVVLWVPFATEPVHGESQVIGSLQPVVAAPGDDVILPCRVEPQADVAGLTVEWSRPDLQPDPGDQLSRVEYVHVYRDSREVLDMKLSAYVERTALFTDGLRRGNISLKITNVTLADEGRYRCFIPKLKSRMRSSIVHLVIEPNAFKTWTTERPLQTSPLHPPGPDEETDVKGGLSRQSGLIPLVGFCVLLILCVGVTGYLTQKRQKQNLLSGESSPMQIMC